MANNETPNTNDVTRKDVVSAMWRHIITLQWSWNYERMQALGWLYSMLPILKKVHKDPEQLKAAMRRNINFYNTNPQVGSPAIFGAAVAMEQQNNGDVADSLKVGLMGPFAGIGDTIQGVLFRPLLAVAAAALAMNGSLLGPLLFIIAGVFWVGIMPWQFWLGYNQGMNLVSEVAGGGRVQKLTEAATVMGLIVIGGFIPSILAGATTPLKFVRTITVQGKATEKVVELQGILDQILPYAIPILLVALAYWLIKSRKWSPVLVLLALAVIAFVGAALHVL
ncbi:MAG: PTS system mannose/fructose/sorbose family transporter subunit IID [Symbiobacteriia bacterium]